MTGISMVQPGHKFEEDDNYIKVTVPVPLSRPNSAAIVLEGNVLTLDSPPYLLNLKLPSKVLDDYSDVAFDNQRNTYTIKLKKDSNANNHSEDDDNKNECPEDELFSLLDTKMQIKKDSSHVDKKFYGFGNCYSNMFGQYYAEFLEIIDLPDPDSTTPKQRTKLRIKDENTKWDVDYYLADLMEPDLELFENYFKYKPPWVTSPVKDKLRNDEIEDLEELPKKDWLKLELTADVKKICQLQMIDILFGYAYDKRISEGDFLITSAWNITKISSTLSWFETFEDLKEVVLTCYRRIITYPLCRSWALADLVKNDVVNILKLGPHQITRCFLQIKDIFNETENCYVLNTLYINDMCHFAYSLSAENAMKLSDELDKIKVEKHEANEELPLYEYAAFLVANENSSEEINEMDVNKLANQFNNFKIKPTAMSSDAESDSDDSSSSGSESTEASDSINENNPGGDEEAPDDEGEEEEGSESEEEEEEDDSDGEEEEDDFEDEEDEGDEEDEDEAEEEEDAADNDWKVLLQNNEEGKSRNADANK